MAEQNRATLKNYFQTGDRPSQAQYADLIDSQLNLAETGIQTMAGALSSSGIECTGDITTTANISASGTVHTTNLTVTSLGSTQVPFIQAGSGGDFEGSGLFTFLGGTLSVPNITQVTTTNIETTGNGHISASGNISSSNKVSGLTGSFGFFEASTSSFGLFESTLISSSNIITHHITASSDISASGNIQALTGSFTNYQGPLLSVTPEQQSIGDAIEQGTATFIKLRQSLGRMDVNCLNGTEKKIVFSTKNLIIDDENGTTTQRTRIQGSITASSDISSSGKITGLTGSFGRLEGLSPITFGDDVIINGNLTASNNGAHLGALLVGTGGYDIDETVTIHSESGAYFLEYDPTGVADGAAYIYKSPPAGTIGVNNEHEGTVNGHIGLFLNNASFRIANSGGQLGDSINEASMSFAQSSSLSAIRFQNLPTSKEQAAQIGTGSLWLSGSADDGTSKFLLVYTG